MDPSTQTTVEYQQPTVPPSPVTPAVAQDPETVIAPATPLADTKLGEISPAADQSNRGAEIAARMAPQVTPVVTVDQQPATPKLSPEEEAVRRRGYRETAEGSREYIDPDELEEKTEAAQAFPTEFCLNCLNHGRENRLNSNGFCPACGFKLDRVRNIKLEPAAKA